jgi:hypothetical protein
LEHSHCWQSKAAMATFGKESKQAGLSRATIGFPMPLPWGFK